MLRKRRHFEPLWRQPYGSAEEPTSQHHSDCGLCCESSGLLMNMCYQELGLKKRSKLYGASKLLE